MELLILLLEREGELVSRSEIVERLWGQGTFLDSDRGINTAISKLRVALRDDSEHPRYIQTVVGKGYRFIAAINQEQVPEVRTSQPEATSTTEAETSAQIVQQPVRRRVVLVAIACVMMVAALTCGYYALQRTHVPSPQTLAVLPFKPLSGGDSDEYLELGMADALITKLSRSGRLIVRPTSAIKKYAADDFDPLAAGRALQVDAVMDGNVQRLGDRLRVSVRLLRVRDGASLWSETYDTRFTDVFQVQDSVSERVGEALAAQLSTPEKANLRRADTANPQAYEMYMRGIFFWNKRSEDGLRKAVSYFEQAIALDPNYALAYAGLASALNPMGYRGYSAPQYIRPRMRAAATRAVALDPTLPEAHVALAATLAFHEWNWAEGEKEFQRALDLNPNLSLAHHWYGILLEMVGRFDEALKQRQRAQELDPITPIIVSALGDTESLMGADQHALVQFHKALELDNSLDHSRVEIGQIYEKQGDYERAISEYRLAVQYAPGSLFAKAALGHALGRAGLTSEASQILNDLKDPAQHEYVSPFHVAIVYEGLGDHEAALNWLDKAYDQRESSLAGIMITPQFNSLHTHPRFRKLVEKMGLTTR